jgi:hypothetical protein
MAQKKPSSQDFSGPPITDFHGRRRELIKLGVEQGHLTWSQIQSAFNQEFINNTELEVLLFTCEQMGIEVRNRPDAS